MVDGLVIAERGARASGLILGTQRAGRVSGTSSLDLELTMVETADGQKIEISTDPWTRRGDTSYGANAANIGGGAALGAIIGAAAGGGKGAAIGAGAGGVSRRRRRRRLPWETGEPPFGDGHPVSPSPRA